MTTTIYTDGACIPNPGPGGWAWAVPEGPYASGAVPAPTTNNRMELEAVLAALRANPGPVVLISDSKYVTEPYQQRWYETWEANGWKNAARKPIANDDLWRPLVEIFRARRDELELRWVAGHSGDAMNDVVDRLAVEAATTQTGRSGDEPPTELGPPDDPGAHQRGVRSPAAGPAAPEGYRLVVFGPGPRDLGGFDVDNPVAADVRRALAEVLREVHARHPDLVVLTGLGLGAEQLAAQAATDAGVGYVAILAVPHPDAKWPAATRAAYQKLADGAVARIPLSKKDPATAQAAGKAFGIRDQWLITHSHVAVVVWDGTDPKIGQTVTALRKRLPDDVHIIAPTT